MLTPSADAVPIIDFSAIHAVEGSVGQYFQTFETASGCEVVVYLFGAGADPGEVARAVESANRLSAAPHAGLVRCFGGRHEGYRAYVVYEKVRGVRLVEVLRRNGRFEVPEALRILVPLAGVIDHAVTHGLEGLDLRMSSIRLVPEGADGEDPGLRLADWPDFQVRLGYAFSHPTSSTAFFEPGAEDNDLGRAHDGFARACGMALGGLTCELLGGARPALRQGRRRFVPVAGLPDALNHVLRKMVTPPMEGGYADASSFLAAFKSAWEHADERTQGALPRRPPYARSGHVPVEDSPNHPAGPGRSRAILLAAVILAAAAAGIALSQTARTAFIEQSALLWNAVAQAGIARAPKPAPEPVVVTVPPEEAGQVGRSTETR